jgi:hypothetical protein
MTDDLHTQAEYESFLHTLTARIARVQVRAALAVNHELVLLYWQIGRDMLARQQQQGWGAKVIEQLSRDLRRAFPDLKGFSRRNLRSMRAFAEAWPDEASVQGTLAHLSYRHLKRPWHACAAMRVPQCIHRSSILLRQLLTRMCGRLRVGDGSCFAFNTVLGRPSRALRTDSQHVLLGRLPRRLPSPGGKRAIPSAQGQPRPTSRFGLSAPLLRR